MNRFHLMTYTAAMALALGACREQGQAAGRISAHAFPGSDPRQRADRVDTEGGAVVHAGVRRQMVMRQPRFSA